MATYFISDLHLSCHRPHTTELFLKFLKTEAKTADALYILGDLFEYWIGDDNTNPHDLRIMQALADFSHTGIPLYFMHGNRDFLIGEEFLQKTQCILLNDPTVIQLYQNPVLLTHGDLLCTLDLRYQRFRRLVRHPLIQKLFLRLPIKWREKIAQLLRRNSASLSSHELKSTPRHWDVALNTVYQFLRDHETLLIIHGHTHKAKIHQFTLDAYPAKRIVLGDWGKEGSVLVYSDQEIILKSVT